MQKDHQEKSEKKTIANKYNIYLNLNLGEGTFAKTYLCKLKGDPSQVFACKVMVKQQIAKIIPDLEYLIQRVKDQIKTWKQLNHPNIVKFQACEETKNNIYFFLQYCPDGSLQQYIAYNKFNPNIPERIKLAKQLISACAYLQSRNILHRDIKPANILLKGNDLKLGDFGLARIIDTNNQNQLKSFFTFAGTLHFMAPQILNSEKYPYKCDVWSVGITIYIMFTGSLPFDLNSTKDNSEALIFKKIQTNSLDLNHKIFINNEGIKEIIRLMLTKNPKERPKMSQIAEHLKNL